MGCDKIKNKCGKKIFASCVASEVDVPQFSSLVGQECVSIEDNIQDLYEIAEGVKNEIDLSPLDLECLSLMTPTVKTLLQLLVTTVCVQQTQLNDLSDTIAIQQQQITALQESNCP